MSRADCTKPTKLDIHTPGWFGCKNLVSAPFDEYIAWVSPPPSEPQLIRTKHGDARIAARAPQSR